MRSFIDYLVETFQTDKVETHHDEEFRGNNKHYGDSPTSGSFGYVELDDNNPHSVVKKPHTPFRKSLTDDKSPDWDDSYYVYIKYIVDNNLAQENPYFPRVFKMETKVDSLDKVMYSIELEKLNPMKSLTDEEGIALAKIIFGDEFDQYISSKLVQMDLKNKWTTYPKLILGYVRHCVEYGYKTQDDMLNNAINILSDLKAKHRYLTYDLHDGNFMFRRSKYGAQLVFVDPFS